LFGGLAFAYKSKTNNDSVNEWHPDRPSVRRVIREVSNTFWFIREILRYGKDCEIVSPKPMRDRFQQQLQGLINLYQDT
jgi:predicted DNA-binding transcriptional regulator YafY